MGGNSVKEKGDVETKAEVHSEHEAGGFAEGLGSLFKPQTEKLGRKFHACGKILKVLYILVGIATAVVALALLAVSVITAVTTKMFTYDQSGRLVALILLAIIAAAVVTITIYSCIAVCKTTGGFKLLVTAAVVLLILAVVQAVIAGVSLRFTLEDEYDITHSLDDTFTLSNLHKSAKYEKMWTTIQYELECCGIRSAEDYRDRDAVTELIDIPISCCPAFDPARSLSSQENERLSCRDKQTYYKVGCRHYVIGMVQGTSATVMAVDIVLILLEVIGAILIFSIIKRGKLEKEEDDEDVTQKPHIQSKTGAVAVNPNNLTIQPTPKKENV